jgi:hypothetical protein
VDIRARTEPWAPEAQLQGEVVLPEGWQAALRQAQGGPEHGRRPAGPEAVAALKPGQVETLTCGLAAPAGAAARFVPVRLKATLGGATITVRDRFDVGRREIVHWMVVGPFPNKSGKLPDTDVHPPENKLDLNGEYDGLGGKVRWQPASLPNKYLHLDQMYKPAQAATAYAVTSLHADEDTKATLNFFCRGSVDAWLNDGKIAAISASEGGGKAVRVPLKKGDNILLCKSSTKGGKWEIAADVAEEGPSDRMRVHQVPATELKGIPVLTPVILTPTVLTPVAGQVLEHTAGVNWRLVLSDNFDRKTIGDKWRVAAGTWTVKNGILAGEERSLLSYVQKVPAPVRIEYDARSVAPHDLSCSWLMEPEDLNSGYLIAFAAGDSGSRVQVEGSLVESSNAPAATAAPNQWYHVIAQVLPNGNAQLYANGKLVLEARPGSPPQKPLYPGLWTWGGGEFAHVRIYAGQWP